MNKETIFQQLADAAKNSKFRKFETEVLRRAVLLTDQYEASGTRKLSLAAEHYVYALMDPRKPGPHTYTLFSGRKITFPFLPFYIGKGKGKRMMQHAIYAKSRSVKAERLSHKENTIVQILESGLEPVAQRISDFCIDAVSMAKEQLLIEGIGRRSTKEGPLTNQASGGEGATGMKWSPETLAKRSETQKEWWARMTPEQLESQVHQRKETIKASGWKFEQHSEATKKKMSEMAKLGGAERLKKNLHSPEARAKTKTKLNDGRMLGINKGRVQNLTPEQRAKKAEDSRNRVWTDESRAKIAAAKSYQPLMTCPHCGKVGKMSGMKTKHFNNCKTLKAQNESSIEY